MNKNVIVNPKKLLIVAIIILVFIVIYPVVEWNISCPDARIDSEGNSSCVWLKNLLWEVVVLFSLYLPGDGLSLTPSLDETNHRNIFPMFMFLIISFIYYQRYK
jgi:hypothetical protein